MTVTRRRLIASVVAIAVVAAVALFLLLRGADEPEPPRPPFDYLAWKASELGNHPERIIAFVRDEIAPEPYQGLLRGPVGTLWSGSGNDADRAALLAGLLQKAGLNPRLARAERYYVQLPAGGDEWRNVLLTADAEAPSDGPAWTGEQIPQEQHHELTITLRATRGDEQM